jgi:hypothetical protein
VYLAKCVTWSPRGLDNFISLPLGFFTPNSGFGILGTSMGFRSFVELFMDFGIADDEEP